MGVGELGQEGAAGLCRPVWGPTVGLRVVGSSALGGRCCRRNNLTWPLADAPRGLPLIGTPQIAPVNLNSGFRSSLVRSPSRK
jgi:hypothetical protein